MPARPEALAAADNKADVLYRRVLDDEHDHRHKCLRLAREFGRSRRQVEAEVAEAAARDSWRIAGLEPPSPGSVIFTIGRGGVLRADEYDEHGIPHPIDPLSNGHSGSANKWPESPDDAVLGPPSGVRVNKRVQRGFTEPRAENGDSRCEVCRKLLVGRQKIVCSKRCRNLRDRLRRGDPKAEAAVRMLTDPPSCEGCAEPLTGKRVGTRFHNDRCRALANGGGR